MPRLPPVAPPLDSSAQPLDFYESMDSPPLGEGEALDLELDDADSSSNDSEAYYHETPDEPVLRDSHGPARIPYGAEYDPLRGNFGMDHVDALRRPSAGTTTTTASPPIVGSFDQEFVDLAATDTYRENNLDGASYQRHATTFRVPPALPPTIVFSEGSNMFTKRHEMPGVGSASSGISISSLDRNHSGLSLHEVALNAYASQSSDRPVLPCSELAAKLSGYSDAGVLSGSDLMWQGNRSLLQGRAGSSLNSSGADLETPVESYNEKMLSEYFFQLRGDQSATEVLSFGGRSFSSYTAKSHESYKLHDNDLEGFDPQSSDTLGPFQLLQVLGKGTSAIVRAARHSETGFEVAIKILTKHTEADAPPQSHIENDDSTDVAPPQRNFMVKIRRETAILKLFDHPNVLKLYDVFETDKYAFLVLERASSGELFDLITRRGRLGTSLAKLLLAQLVQALRHCHRLGVAHRDVKPENVLLDSKYVAKLCDFGMAKSFAQIASTVEDGVPSEAKAIFSSSGEPLLTTACGSPHYASPELLKGLPYDGCKSDTWSLGIVAYALITGSLPFDSPRLSTLFQLIIRGEFYMPSFVPPDYAALIRALLDPNPETRISLDDVPSHPCFASSANRLGYLFATPTSAAEAAILLSLPDFPLKELRPEPEWQAALLMCPKLVTDAQLRARGFLSAQRGLNANDKGGLNPRSLSDRVDQTSHRHRYSESGHPQEPCQQADGYHAVASSPVPPPRIHSLTRYHSSEHCPGYEDSDSASSQHSDSETNEDSDIDYNDDVVKVGRPHLVPIRRTVRYGTLVPQLAHPRSPDLCSIKAISISPKLTSARLGSASKSPALRASPMRQLDSSPITAVPISGNSQFLRLRRDSSKGPDGVSTPLMSKRHSTAARVLTFVDQPIQSAAVAVDSLPTLPDSSGQHNGTRGTRHRAWSCDADPSLSMTQFNQERRPSDGDEFIRQQSSPDLASNAETASTARRNRSKLPNVAVQFEARPPSPAESYVLQTTNLYRLAPPVRTRQSSSLTSRVTASVSSSSSASASPGPQSPLTSISPTLFRAASTSSDVPNSANVALGAPLVLHRPDEQLSSSPLVSARSASGRTPASVPNSKANAYLRRNSTVEHRVNSGTADSPQPGVGPRPDAEIRLPSAARVLLFSPIEERTGMETLYGQPQGPSMPIDRQQRSDYSLLSPARSPVDPSIARVLSSQNAPLVPSGDHISRPPTSQIQDPIHEGYQPVPLPMSVPNPPQGVPHDVAVTSSPVFNGGVCNPLTMTPVTVSTMSTTDMRKSNLDSRTETLWFSPTVAIDELTVLDLSALGWGTPNAIRSRILQWHRLMYEMERRQIKELHHEGRHVEFRERSAKQSGARSPYCSPIPTLPFSIVRGKGTSGATAPTLTASRTTTLESATGEPPSSPRLGSSRNLVGEEEQVPLSSSTQSGRWLVASPNNASSRRPSRTLSAQSNSTSTSTKSKLAPPQIPEALRAAPRVVFYYYLLLKRKRRRLRQLCRASPRLFPASPTATARSLTLSKVVVKEEEVDEADDELQNDGHESKGLPCQSLKLCISNSNHVTDPSQHDHQPGKFALTMSGGRRKYAEMMNDFEPSGITPLLRPFSLDGNAEIPPLPASQEMSSENSEGGAQVPNIWSTSSSGSSKKIRWDESVDLSARGHMEKTEHDSDSAFSASDTGMLVTMDLSMLSGTEVCYQPVPQPSERDPQPNIPPALPDDKGTGAYLNQSKASRQD